MKRTYIITFVMIGILAISLNSCSNMGNGSASNPIYNSKSKPASSFGNDVAFSWLDMLALQNKQQRITPPPVARTFGYYGAALYQSVCAGIPDGKSLDGQLKGFTNVPKPDNSKEYDWPTVANHCLYMVCDEMLARFLSANDHRLIQLKNKNDSIRKASGITDAVFANSKDYGDALGQAFVAYAKTDNFDYTRENNIYESPTRIDHPERWEPTDINKTALEPFWGTIRPLGLDSSDLCAMKPTTPYSTDPNSAFYKDVLDVYGIDTSMTEDERIISLYWADQPVDTYTPPGHWMMIGKQQARSHGYNLAQTAQLFAYMGMSLHDIGISMWKVKYEVNLVRPNTYIHEVLNKPDWEPYIETPPFPEYPSGHSGFSGAAAEVMTKFFGDNQAFIDSTNLIIGLMPRSFKSYYAASDEAAFSRHVGGIHFTAAIQDGKTMGHCIADKLIKKVDLGGLPQPATASASSK